MREIEFRGKSVDTKEWVCGYYIYDEIVREHLIIPAPTNGDFRYCGVPVDPKTVGQLVGRPAGKKAYKGDVLKRFHYKDAATKKSEYLYHVVKWNERRLQWEAVNINDINIPEDERTGTLSLYVYALGGAFEIIGNEIDSPELLKEAT